MAIVVGNQVEKPPEGESILSIFIFHTEEGPKFEGFKW